jgi:hypothetical protein
MYVRDRRTPDDQLLLILCRRSVGRVRHNKSDVLSAKTENAPARHLRNCSSSFAPPSIGARLTDLHFDYRTRKRRPPSSMTVSVSSLRLPLSNLGQSTKLSCLTHSPRPTFCSFNRFATYSMIHIAFHVPLVLYSSNPYLSNNLLHC